MSNFLITGFHGEPHVTAENDRGLHAAQFGGGRYVLPVGQRFRAEYIGNNTIRLYDGKLVDGGAAGGIPAGEYIDLYVPETAQGMYRNDLIVFQYEQSPHTLIETGSFVVVLGTEAATAEEAADPELQQQDLLSGTATFDQMPLWRVSVASTVISEPVALFEPLAEHQELVKNTDDGLRTVGGKQVLVGGGCDLLWENASPGSSFLGTTIYFDTTKYELIFCIYSNTGTAYADGEPGVWGMCFVPTGTETGGFVNDCLFRPIGSGGSTLPGRTCTFYPDRMEISEYDGLDTNRVPFRIYGIRKGV